MSASARAFVCECGDTRCGARPRLTDAEYAGIRRRGLKLVSSEHGLEDGNKIVERGPGWVAVGRRRRVAPAGPAVAKPQHVPETCYCGRCEADTIPSESGRCLWCGELLVLSEAV